MGELSVQYCLKLPQHLYNVTDNTVEDISMSPKKKRVSNDTRMDEFLKSIEAHATPNPAQKLLFTSEDGLDEDTGKEPGNGYDNRREESDHNASRVAAQGQISPKCKCMFGKEEKDHKKGYYSAFTFLNSQQEFHKTFGRF